MNHDYFPAAASDELAPGQMKRLEHRGHRILLANVDGELLAVENNCSHEDVPLHLGCLEGDRIRCSLHGSRFDLRSGRPLEEPAEEPIRTYAVKIEAGKIWVAVD
jgi:3-phenylpropionate/trans-cinnamate dioxygenase ferredoxin subunit